MIEPNHYLLEVTKNMQCVMDEISGFPGDMETIEISQISEKMSKIGWTSLYTSMIIDELTRNAGDTSTTGQFKQLSSQVDSLQLATNYIEKSIQQLKEKTFQLPSNQAENFLELLKDFGNRLVEVSNVCK